MRGKKHFALYCRVSRQMRAKGKKSPAWGMMQVKRITERTFLSEVLTMGSRKTKK
jgi:hypothetical protein